MAWNTPAHIIETRVALEASDKEPKEKFYSWRMQRQRLIANVKQWAIWMLSMCFEMYI